MKLQSQSTLLQATISQVVIVKISIIATLKVADVNTDSH